MSDIKKLTLEDVENIENGYLLYKYIRGSHSYGLNIETSDIDYGGVFQQPVEQTLGLKCFQTDQVADDRNDVVYYEIEKYLHLLMKSNPTILESLFVDDEFVVYEHPIISYIKKHKKMFLSKDAFNAFGSYAYTQIKKCRGLNKKIVNPINRRLDVLDFAYTFYKQGSCSITTFLEFRGLYQQYCGLVNIPNMHDIYACYYDWGNFFLNMNISFNDILDDYELFMSGYEYDSFHCYKKINKLRDSNNTDSEEYKELMNEFKLYQGLNRIKFIIEKYNIKDYSELEQWYNLQKPIGYSGMVGIDGMSNQLRLSSVSKNESAICNLYYNQDGYIHHCREYNEYQQWVKNRNEDRYRENVENSLNFDRKNVAHSVRLVHQAIELAKTGQFNVNRRNIDRDFILKIRLGHSTYDEVISYIEQKKLEMDEAIKHSTLPDHVDPEFVNELLVNIRKYQIGLIDSFEGL